MTEFVTPPVGSPPVGSPPAAERHGLVVAVLRQARARADFLRYVVIGGCAFLLDVGLFAVLHLVAGLEPLAANAIAVFTSMVFSFTLNAFANFKVRDRLLPRFVSFVAVCLLGYLISTGLLWLLITLLAVAPVLAKILSLPVVLAVQFLANKHVTFGSALFTASEKSPS